MALADGTKSNQISNIKSFLSFCELFNFPSLPTRSDILVRYVTHSIVIRGMALGTVRNHLSSIRREHLTHGYSLPTPSDYFPLSDVLRGARRFQSRTPKKMLAIDPRLLSRLVSIFPFGSPVRCLFLLMYCTFARLASVIPAGRKENFSSLDHLVWSDLRFSGDGVIVHLKKTKTIQCKERVLEFDIPVQTNKSLCLTRNLLKWLSVTPLRSPQDPVFLTLIGGHFFPMTRSMVTPSYKGALILAGARANKFGWSSFRRGAATSYFLATGDVETLRVHGDWRSLCYREYLSLPATARAGVPGVLLNGL